MSKLVLSGDTSGSVTISSPAVSGTTTLTLPTTSGTVLTGSGAIGVNASAPASSLNIDSSGNVGIGTSSPIGKFDVGGASTAALNTTAYIHGTDNASYGQALAFRRNGSNSFVIGDSGNILGSGGGATILYTYGANHQAYYTNGSERMRIDSSGNVGIGTTSPSAGYKVDVANSGDIKFLVRSTTNATTGNSAYTLQSASGANWLLQTGYDMSNAIRFYDQTAGAERMRIDSSGNVGIGTSSPVNKLQVNDGSASTMGVVRIHNPTNANNNYGSSILFSNENGGVNYGLGQISAIRTNNAANYDAALVFSSSNNSTITERMRITAAGEVYIAGTTDQGAYNLQCNGTGVWGAGAYVNGSDERIKQDITPINSGLDVVNKLNPVTYKYKENWSKDRSTQTGFIAQELLVALEGKNYVDGIVQQGGEYMSVAYQNIIPLLTKAIQEQQTIINDLKTRIETLESK